MHIIKGWKTLTLNVLLGMVPAVTILVQIMSIPEWESIIPNGYWPQFCLVLALLNIILRFFTTTPIGRKE